MTRLIGEGRINGREVWSNLRYYAGIYVVELRKAANNLVSGRRSEPGTSRAPFCGVSTKFEGLLDSRCSISSQFICESAGQWASGGQENRLLGRQEAHLVSICCLSALRSCQYALLCIVAFKTFKSVLGLRSSSSSSSCFQGLQDSCPDPVLILQPRTPFRGHRVFLFPAGWYFITAYDSPGLSILLTCILCLS